MVFNLPDNVSIGDLPGFRPVDAKFDEMENRLNEMEVIDKLELLEEIYSIDFLVQCFNEALKTENPVDNYNDKSAEEIEKMTDYIISFKRNEILEYMVENY